MYYQKGGFKKIPNQKPIQSATWYRFPNYAGASNVLSTLEAMGVMVNDHLSINVGMRLLRSEWQIPYCLDIHIYMCTRYKSDVGISESFTKQQDHRISQVIVQKPQCWDFKKSLPAWTTQNQKDDPKNGSKNIPKMKSCVFLLQNSQSIGVKCQMPKEYTGTFLVFKESEESYNID